MGRIGFFQFEPRFGAVEENLERVVSGLHGVEADLVILPELAFTGYLFEDREELLSLAEDPVSSPTVERLRCLCQERDLFLVTGFAERCADKVFNSALLIGPGGLVHTYRKLHLFNTEKEYFDPGDTPLEPVEIRGTRIGMMVCFDWAFPETARVLALKGADILCHPSNLVLPLCQQAMVTRCLENGVFAVTANRIGSDRRPRGVLRFTGQSQVVTPKGEILHRATQDREELYVTEIKVNLARSKKMTEKNNLFEDRRPLFYTPLTDGERGPVMREMKPER
jgi:predicted amidohydrolase